MQGTATEQCNLPGKFNLFLPLEGLVGSQTTCQTHLVLVRQGKQGHQFTLKPPYST